MENSGISQYTGMRRMKTGDEVRFGYFIPQTYWVWSHIVVVGIFNFNHLSGVEEVF